MNANREKKGRELLANKDQFLLFIIMSFGILSFD